MSELSEAEREERRRRLEQMRENMRRIAQRNTNIPEEKVYENKSGFDTRNCYANTKYDISGEEIYKKSDMVIIIDPITEKGKTRYYCFSYEDLYDIFTKAPRLYEWYRERPERIGNPILDRPVFKIPIEFGSYFDLDTFTLLLQKNNTILLTDYKNVLIGSEFGVSSLHGAGERVYESVAINRECAKSLLESTRSDFKFSDVPVERSDYRMIFSDEPIGYIPPYIKELSLFNNGLENLESIPTNLETLDIYKNNISSIKFITDTKLRHLEINFANITDIDYVLPETLQYISIVSINMIENIDWEYTGLTYIYLKSGNLKSIKVPSTLKDINLFNFNGETLDFSNCPDLQSIYITSETLKTIIYHPGTKENIRTNLAYCPNLIL